MDKMQKLIGPMTDDDYKKLMFDVGMPNSTSLLAALKQVANHTAQYILQQAVPEALMREEAAATVSFSGDKGDLFAICNDETLPIGTLLYLKPCTALADSVSTVQMPEGLAATTKHLILNFAQAMAEKLYVAQEKYSYSDSWLLDDWKEKCTTDLHTHIAKGDPVDVANYCAFMWYHKWTTATLPELKE